ncbi:hypothetical protein EJ06DRAFT_532830 [Trichodelitschia bisporula]|uniref:Uncharacterized protein n=1 Tax=Trichodelitschia bisporula TaxID=703511 RepID=A0A6G1HQ06_9PEZI|nr:hypothetical protein EJ06DRAFT_532830 [Trichodelitschia bisporula]
MLSFQQLRPDRPLAIFPASVLHSTRVAPVVDLIVISLRLLAAVRAQNSRKGDLFAPSLASANRRPLFAVRRFGACTAAGRFVRATSARSRSSGVGAQDGARARISSLLSCARAF